MDIEQCWSHYLKAEELNQQGHWPEAYHLYDDVLSSLPDNIQIAVMCNNTKPCQLACLLDGFRTATVNQSEILNNLGKRKEAFELLNQTYAYFQFLTLESADLLKALQNVLHKHCEDLFRHLAAFCAAQRSASWMLEMENIQKAHHHFYQLQHTSPIEPSLRLN
ncbi:hypothetical protein [Vibrio tapetis]|uniref:Tetratricopeptide repeat protein n=1 Tax=Vibrio tapetis subsp. tapetis TaxID=1671868 RepID=A0A2N8ZLQ1_9VIBR|nr:hypothetical protein [Vibrio tapetis]SON52830.1 conserved protein of unknown function [Vibrio tapetis subsp. tapetis]